MIKNVNTQHLLQIPVNSSTDVWTTFRRLSVESIFLSDSVMVGWYPTSANLLMFIVFEKCFFKKSTMYFVDYTQIYVEKSTFHGILTAAIQNAFKAGGQISSIGCTFINFVTGIKTDGDAGKLNPLLVCHSEFTGCTNCIDTTNRGHFFVKHCRFCGWSGFALSVAWLGAVGVKNAFHLTVTSVCFGFNGVEFDTCKIDALINCKFAASFETAVSGGSMPSGLNAGTVADYRFEASSYSC
jgi:hypothetical protein